MTILLKEMEMLESDVMQIPFKYRIARNEISELTCSQSFLTCDIRQIYQKATQ